jgi:PKD repeat protein
VGGNVPGCENYFVYTVNDQHTVTFEGFLMNGQVAQYYSWDFGDGTYGSGQTVTHTYTPQGIAMYLVGLTTMVFDPATNDSCMYTSYQEVWLENYPGCSAYFYYYPDSSNLATINFYDMSYGPNGLPPVSWFWEFGDGTSSGEQNPVHTYADTGYYMVCLTINAADSCTSTYCEEVYTGIIPPPSDCESFILPLNMYGLTVDFEGYTISPYETEYTWEFGDGVTGTGQFISHTYPAAGMYNVTLQTMDATGCYFQTFSQIWLDSTNQGGCNAMYTYEQTDSTTFSFYGYIYFNNGMIYPDSSAVYSWDFGDGTFGSGQNITHYFQPNPAGGYNVCLTATAIAPDGSTCTATYCEYIYLVQPSFNIFGYVYLENNMPADQAMVHLMSMDSTWQGVVEVQTITIDSGGFYSFNNVPMYNSRLYFVQAELTEGSAYFGEYLPTYHLSALSWELASPVLPLNNWTADVFMIAGNTVDGGSGSITGVVSNLGTRGFMNDVEVVLMDAQKNPLIYTRSNEQGEFTFSNLPMGTYVIHAELMGIHTNQAEVTLSEQQPSASVEVQVTSTEANVVFGVHEFISLEEASEIYPNPVADYARIDLTLKEEATIKISTISLTGQLVSEDEIDLGKGTHSIVLESASLPEGIYMVRIMSEHGDMMSRKLMVSR